MSTITSDGRRVHISKRKSAGANHSQPPKKLHLGAQPDGCTLNVQPLHTIACTGSEIWAKFVIPCPWGRTSSVFNLRSWAHFCVLVFISPVSVDLFTNSVPWICNSPPFLSIKNLNHTSKSTSKATSSKKLYSTLLNTPKRCHHSPLNLHSTSYLPYSSHQAMVKYFN